MPFGSRQMPRFILGQPGTRQTWRYRDKDIEVTPYQLPGGVAWNVTPYGRAETSFPDPHEAVAHARFWIDYNAWRAEVKRPDSYMRGLLVDSLLSLARDCRSRSQLGTHVAMECRTARSASGDSQRMPLSACVMFDTFSLSERRRLLDEVYQQIERERRSDQHAAALARAPRLRPRPSNPKRKPKTIGPLTPKPDDPRWTTQEAQAAAVSHEFAVSRVPASAYRWRYRPAYPIETIGWYTDETGIQLDSPETWIEWIREEDARHRAGGRSPYLGPNGLEEVWLADPEDRPLVLVEEHEGTYLWDGHHRLAIAYLHDLRAVPAFVGTPRKSQLKPKKKPKKRTGNPKERRSLMRKLLRQV